MLNNQSSSNTQSGSQRCLYRCLPDRPWLAALLLWSSLAGAETALLPPLETVVVTGNRAGQVLAQEPGNTAVIDAQALERVRARHVQEALVRVAGANMARGNGQEYLPAVRSPVLTGESGCGSVLSALDGVPLRAAGFCNINELFDAPTEMAGRIEVVRGPGSVMYGSNATHGIVNIITPAVGSEPLSAFSAELGPHDYSLSTLALARRQDAHGLRLDLAVSHDGGYQDSSGLEQQKISLLHDYTRDAVSVRTHFSASHLNQDTAGYIEGDEVYKDDALRNDNPSPDAYRNAESARLASHIAWQPADSALQLRVTPYLRYTDMDFLQHFLPGQPVEKNGQKSVGVQTLASLAVSAQGALQAGVDVEYTDAFLEQLQARPTTGSAFLQATIPVGQHYDYRVDAVTLAPFVQARWQWQERLTGTLGVRYETLRYAYDNRMLDGRTDDQGVPCAMGGCRYNRPGDRVDEFEHASPKAALLYQINPALQAYLNLAWGFRMPQATELYRLQREQASASLDTETLRSTELGLRGSQARWQYEVLVYAMAKDNVIYRDTSFFNVPEGESEHRGIELALGYALAADWQFNLAASYARHTYANDWLLEDTSVDGNDMDAAPRHFGSAQLLWAFRPDSSAELEWVHQGRYYTDPENLHSYAGHELLNLRVSWQVNPRWRTFARLANVTNTEYAERADYTAFGGDRYFPGEPRSLYVGVESRW